MPLPKPEPLAPTRIPDCETPLVAPGKPPLRVGDGMIEVGWEPTAEPEPEADDGSGLLVGGSTLAPVGPKVPASGSSAGTVEVIDDHYAALQAWTEWAQNQGRDPVTLPPGSEESGEAVVSTDDAADDQDRAANSSASLAGLAGVRAESQHDFAPYSQLFSRIRQPRDRQ